MAHRQLVVLGRQHIPRHGPLAPSVLQTTEGIHVKSCDNAHFLRFRIVSLHHYCFDATLLHLGSLQAGQQGEIKEAIETLLDSSYA